MLPLPHSLDHLRHARCRRSSCRAPQSPHMDAATLRSLALRGGGYSTPRLNESLHASSAGLVGFLGGGVFRNDDAGGNEDEDENSGSPLAAYSSLKSLHLSDNGFVSLEGMPRLEELRCLFIERNCLTTLRGLSCAAPSLSTLDASGNRLTSLSVEGRGTRGSSLFESDEGGCLPRTLTTLRLSGNDLSAPGAIDGLFIEERSDREGERGRGVSESDDDGAAPPPPPSSLLPNLSTLDLSHCSISDADSVLSLVASLPSIRSLYLQGNPFWDELRVGQNKGNGPKRSVGARLAVLVAAPSCSYLNDSPVFGEERAAADALRASGGCAAAPAAAREAFLDAAAAVAERTTRLLERPPRFLFVDDKEEESDQGQVSGDENEEKGHEEGNEEAGAVAKGE